MEREFSFRWIVENFRYNDVFWINNIKSPQFTPEGLGGTSCSLSLFSSFYSRSSHFHVYLSRSADDPGPDSVSLQFQISATFHGSTVLSEEREHTFRKGEEFDLGPFASLKKLCEKQNTEDAPQDSLCVRCRMWWGVGSLRRVTQCTARTRAGFERVFFLHRVPNFSRLRKGEEKTLRIPSQYDGGCDFTSTLRIGHTLNAESVCVSIVSSNSNYWLLKEKWSFLDVSGNIIQINKDDLSKQFLLDKKEEYLPNDEFSLLCECVFITGVKHDITETLYDLPVEVYQSTYSMPQHRNDRSAAKESSAQPSAPRDSTLNHKDPLLANVDLKASTCSASRNVKSTNNDLLKKQHSAAEKLLRCPSVQEDFKALYNDQLLTDIVLKTETKSFPAHRNVLCARSSVLRAMLTCDMRERNTDCIRVDDLDEDAVQRLLLFLYSDCLEELQWESAVPLYYAADKYAVEKLKVLCSSFLVDNITETRGIELLRLADTHSDAELKSFAENFILQHDEEIFCSEDWEKLHETHPLLVMKTMQLKYKKKKEGK